VPAETLRRWLKESGWWQRQRRRKPYRRRTEAKAHFDELVQLDGSFHEWLEERGPRGCLMHMVDDATAKALGYHTDNRSEQMRPLGHRRANEQPRIGTAEDGEFVGFRSPGLNEPLGSGDEVIECHLAITAFRSLMPFGSELRTATDIWQGKQATLFHEKMPRRD
jgi:hypothetical protein